MNIKLSISEAFEKYVRVPAGSQPKKPGLQPGFFGKYQEPNKPSFAKATEGKQDPKKDQKTNLKSLLRSSG